MAEKETTATAPATDVKRKTLKKVGNVLLTSVKVPKDFVIKKGLKILKTDALYDSIFRKDTAALNRIDESTFEVAKDISISMGEILPPGTQLDAEKDKELIAQIKAANPAAIGEAEVIG